MLSLADFEKILAAPRESGGLEFKEAKAQFDFEKLCQYCVAIANEGGGTLFLGVADSLPRQVVGTAAFQSLPDVKKRLFDKLKFRVEAEEIGHANGRVLAFLIPGRPAGTAYTFEGAYLMRSEDRLMPMSEDRLRMIFNEGKPNWLAGVAKDGATEADVVKLLDTQAFFDLQKLPYPAARAPVIERLVREDCVIETPMGFEITNLGAILFAKRLEDFGLARKAVRVIVYEGKGKVTTKLDQIGQKGYAVGFSSLMTFVNSHVPRNEVIGAAFRNEVKMFPEIAIRELVANAIIHQDFTETGASMTIEIYPDRIEISNPGKPFVPPERFIDAYKSRNESLADLMRRLGICEEKGSGIDKVVFNAEAFQLPAPDFRTDEIRTTAVLFGHKKFGDMDGRDRVRACYQHCCLKYVMNDKMSNQSLRTRFQLSEEKSETVSRIIRETADAGLIKLDNPETASKRYARYVPFWA